jgi:hypothetical protein
LGEFSPLGRLFPLGTLPKITKVGQFFGLLFSTEQIMCIVLTKKWVGLLGCQMVYFQTKNPILLKFGGP